MGIDYVQLIRVRVESESECPHPRTLLDYYALGTVSEAREASRRMGQALFYPQGHLRRSREDRIAKGACATVQRIIHNPITRGSFSRP